MTNRRRETVRPSFSRVPSPTWEYDGVRRFAFKSPNLSVSACLKRLCCTGLVLVVNYSNVIWLLGPALPRHPATVKVAGHCLARTFCNRMSLNHENPTTTESSVTGDIETWKISRQTSQPGDNPKLNFRQFWKSDGHEKTRGFLGTSETDKPSIPLTLGFHTARHRGNNLTSYTCTTRTKVGSTHAQQSRLLGSTVSTSTSSVHAKAQDRWNYRRLWGRCIMWRWQKEDKSTIQGSRSHSTGRWTQMNAHRHAKAKGQFGNNSILLDRRQSMNSRGLIHTVQKHWMEKMWHPTYLQRKHLSPHQKIKRDHIGLISGQLS